MTPQERLNQRENFLARVFENVMAGVGEVMHFGAGKAVLPFVEEVAIEDEIVLAPAN